MLAPWYLLHTARHSLPHRTAKLARALSLAHRSGNFARIQMAEQQAAALPPETRARARGSQYIEAIYEGFGPQEVALVLVCATDNLNRLQAKLPTYLQVDTASGIRYLFETKGILQVARAAVAEDQLLEQLEGLEEYVAYGENWLLQVDSSNFYQAWTYMIEQGWHPHSAALCRIPVNTVALPTAEAENVRNLIDTLEADDDIQQVFHNLAPTPDILPLWQKPRTP